MNKNKERMLRTLSARWQQSHQKIEHIKEEAKMLPELEKDKRITETHIKMINDIPDNVDIPDNFIFLAQTEYAQHTQIVQQGKPSIQPSPLISGMSSSIAYIDYVSQTKEYIDSGSTWADDIKTTYKIFHDHEKHEREVAILLDKLNPDLAIEFKEAMNDYAKVNSDISKQADLAFRFRTIMEKAKGDLKSKLKIQAKNNMIFDELAIDYTDGVGMPDFLLLMAEKSIHVILHDRFSNIGKLNDKPNPLDFEVLSDQFVDHIYAVLSILARHVKGIW